ncbi:MAG: hypothetical protein AAGC55_24445 [Myxococcota bacterium]
MIVFVLLVYLMILFLAAVATIAQSVEGAIVLGMALLLVFWIMSRTAQAFSQPRQ